MKFNPVLRREKMIEKSIGEPKSLLDYFLNDTYDPSKPMGNFAISDTNCIISCWLLGLHNEVMPVLPRIIDWLNIAIEQDENCGMHRNYHRYNLRSSLALAKWLQNGDAAIEDWELARVLAHANLTDSVYQKNKIKTDGLNDYLSDCIQAEQYEAGIAEFEKYHGAKTISLKKTLSPREYGYALCLNEVNQQFDPETLLLAGRKMLQANLEDHPWLGYGQYHRAAIWLKNVYWHHNRSLTPLETILKAYDNMPNVARPDFIK